MRNTKLYSILEQFDKYEQNRCRKFLQSPYFNKDKTLVNLFELAINVIYSEKDQNWEKEVLWQKLELAPPYDDTRLRKYFSDLTKLVEQYLSQEIFEANSFQKASYLMQAAFKKKIEKLYGSSTKSANDLFLKYPYRSADYYYYQYTIQSNYYGLQNYDIKRDERSNIEEISSNLDYFYITEKLKFLCTIIQKQNFTSYKYNIFLHEEIISHIKNNISQYQEIPSIYIYFAIYLTLTEPEKEEHYYKLKELLNNYSHLFPIKFAVDEFYSAAQNYCVIKLNQGDQKFVKEVVDLYKDMDKKGILVVEGEIYPWTFRNAVILGLRLGETDWVENFITTYQSFLPEAMRENAVTFNLAQLYFYQKKYEKVIELLQEVEFEDMTYNLNSKTFLLMTYYEINEIEPLYSLFESFRTYLNRRKDIPHSRRQNFLKLIQFTRKLTKLITGDKKNIEKLRLEITAAKSAASYNWLLEKIAELE